MNNDQVSKVAAETKLLTLIELYASMLVVDRWMKDEDFSDLTFEQVRAMQQAERGWPDSDIDDDTNAEYIKQLDAISEGVVLALMQKGGK
jgi:hypothetical protein